MVKKIFKREFVRSLKTVLIFLGIIIFISLFSGIVSHLSLKSDVFLLNLLAELFTTITYLGIVALSTVSLVIVYAGVYKATATDEAYLTFTLPVSMKDQLKARFLVCLCYTLMIGAVAALGMIVLNVLSFDRTYFTPVEVVEEQIDPFVVVFIIEAILFGVCAIPTGISQILFAIIFGSQHAKKRKLGAVILTLVIMGAIEHFAGIFIMVGGVFVVMLAEENGFFLPVNVFMAVLIAVEVAVGILLYKATRFSLERRLNVE